MPDLKDGFATLEGGMDSSTSPEIIGLNQVSFAVNCRFRKGYLRNRPGFDKITLNFDDPAVKTLFSAASASRIQGFSFFDGNFAATNVFIAAVQGRLFQFLITGNSAQVTEISVPGGNWNDPTQDFNYMVQAGTYFVVNDNQSAPIIFDGSTTRRAGNTEVPTGTVMAFGLGRLIVARGRQFFVGDIDGGPTPVISFTENIYLTGGGSFILPLEMGNVTGMSFQTRQDTQTGQGTLLVFGERGVISVNLLIPRDQWGSTIIQEVALVGIGGLSAWVTTNVNGDVLFRSIDGIRSFRDARAQEGGFGKTPISSEMNRVLDLDSTTLIPFASGVYFDNRFLMTCNHQLVNGIGVANGIVAMDFDPVSSNREKAPPEYDGLWTGINPVYLAVGSTGNSATANNERCFALCNHGGAVELWEITTDDVTDYQGSRIESYIETRATNFGDPFQPKKLSDARIWLSAVSGQVDFEIDFKSDYYPGWFNWRTFDRCVAYEVCDAGCATIPSLQPGSFPGLLLGTPPKDCYECTGKEAAIGYTFQTKIKWTGQATINKFLMLAQGEVSYPKLYC